jgi:hypothetical protein
MLINKVYYKDANNGKEGTDARKGETLTLKRWQYKEVDKEMNGLL